MRSTSCGSAYLPSSTWEPIYEYRNRSSGQVSRSPCAHARRAPELPHWLRLCGCADTGVLLGFVNQCDLSAWHPDSFGGSRDCADGGPLGVLPAHLERAGPDQQRSRARLWHFRGRSPGIRLDDHHGESESQHVAHGSTHASADAAVAPLSKATTH